MSDAIASRAAVDGSAAELSRVLCVTFPRSGHHLLLNMLMRYFARDVEFPLTDGRQTSTDCAEVLCAGPLHYCEIYTHCGQVPCTDERTNLQKHHDHALDLDPEPSRATLVQVRHPLESLVSHFEFQVRGTAVEDSAEGWSRFLGRRPDRMKLFRNAVRGRTPLADLKGAWPGNEGRRIPRSLEHWRRFMWKWALASLPGPTLLVRYGDLVDAPRETCVRAIRFLSQGAAVDEPFVDRVVESVRVSRRRPLDQFRYFDAAAFRSLERAVLPELRAAGLTPIFCAGGSRDR